MCYAHRHLGNATTQWLDDSNSSPGRGKKRSECEADHPSAIIIEVKNAWSFYLHSLFTRNCIAKERERLEGRALNLTQKHAANSQGCQPDTTLP
jgi:hypothetical protein